MTMENNFDIKKLHEAAKYRWLKPVEVYFILQNHENYELNETTPQKPPSGSLFLFNKRVLRFFRKDGHNWRRKKSGRTVGEGHERLKVGNSEALNCYYAHGEENPNFQRRSYWMLDLAYEHIVLVHYREITEGRHDADAASLPGYSSLTLSTSISSGGNQSSVSAASKLDIPQQNLFSPGFAEVSSELENGKIGLTDGIGEFIDSSVADYGQMVQTAQKPLSLTSHDIVSFPSFQESKTYSNSEIPNNERSNVDESVPTHCGSEYGDIYEKVGLHESNSTPSLENSGEYEMQGKESLIWKNMLDQHLVPITSYSQDEVFNALDGLDTLPSYSERIVTQVNQAEQQEKWASHQLDSVRNSSENLNNHGTIVENGAGLQFSERKDSMFGFNDLIASPTSTSLAQEVENSKISPNSSGTSTYEASSEYCTMYDQENQFVVPLAGHSLSTFTQKHKFEIHEISPEWGYSMEETKVIITGSFLCDLSEQRWTCMFGNIEVPAQIIQNGVLRCYAPPHIPGKIGLSIGSGVGEPCSQLREFEYRDSSPPKPDTTKSVSDMLLLVQFSEMVFDDSLIDKEDGVPITSVTRNTWANIVEGLLVGSENPSSTMEWLVEELLKDKLQQWLSSKYNKGDSSNFSLPKGKQNIIHIAAGLGFEWALCPILNTGVSVNIRDVNGWTALHWAARFGREKMVAALIAAGASAEAVTDPTSQDPVGKTAGSIAAAHGHKGLAGYLSEVALTSHLSSLTLEESEHSKESASVLAERTVESVSKESIGVNEDQRSLSDSLAAVRNAALAAARIKAAFRAYSFRKRQLKESIDALCNDFGLTLDDVRFLGASPDLSFNLHNDPRFNRAALSIQKKYRGWRGRQAFLALRQKIVMIQAHIRGYQVRKRYKVMVWAVGVLDKVVLRWCRGRSGLRGLQPSSPDEVEYEEVIKVFRKQKVDKAVADALSQVLSMVESSNARNQYRRLLVSYLQAKANLSSKTSEKASVAPANDDAMENDDYYQFLCEQTLDEQL
ncbi:hypothetical protein Sjap_023271 [Stephania japonica]|uniref:CG-1 domain-containing protein n=1 Tax=Stephania japonica TaxID=461633 RepID=A0AAP0EBC9_9MAGN